VAPDEKQLSLNCRNAAKGDCPMEVSNMMSVEDFKKMYIAKLEEDI